MDIEVSRALGFTDEQWTGAFVSALRFGRKVESAPGCYLVRVSINTSIFLIRDKPGESELGIRYSLRIFSPLGTFDRIVDLGPRNEHRSFTEGDIYSDWRYMTKLSSDGLITPVDFMREFPMHHKMLSFHVNQWIQQDLLPQNPGKEELIQKMCQAIGKVEPETE